MKRLVRSGKELQSLTRLLIMDIPAFKAEGAGKLLKKYITFEFEVSSVGQSVR